MDTQNTHRWVCDQECGEEPWCAGDDETRLRDYEECTCGGGYVKAEDNEPGFRWDRCRQIWVWEKP